VNGALKPLIVPVFLPHQGCPHRCVFCNQYRITGASDDLPKPADFNAAVERFLSFGSKARNSVQIAFFGGNFLGLPAERLDRLLGAAAEFVHAGRADGIRFSTRPDSVTPAALARLAPYPVTDVELGVQSMNDAVLRRCRRGHTAADARSAAARIQTAGYRLGLQMMVGLPGETEGNCFATARRMAALAPDYVRIYPTLVLADSPLAAWLHAGKYHPLTLEESLDRVQELALFFFKRGIAVIRMGLPDGLGADGILAGPRHPAFGHRVHSRLFLKMARNLLVNGSPHRSAVAFRIHPGSYSRLQGHRGENLADLRRRFGISRIQLSADATVPTDGLQLKGREGLIRYRDLTSRVDQR